jgi:phenylpropionate dioxygenase-like ring-hydroxylating dioxygenase large terminal subunit
MFLQNAWYVAGFADEVEGDRPLARTLLDEPVVLFRGSEGRLAALADRCPHRFAPLSKGTVCGPERALQCGYHGLKFGLDGACVHNPHGPIPVAARVKSYPVVERHGLIWLWAGRPALADAAYIPDYSEFSKAPEDGTIRGYLPTHCHYQLIVDNILDLTHADYLHAGGLGNGSITRSKGAVTDISPSSLRVSWSVTNEPAPPAFDMHLREQGQLSDQWNEVTWTAPGNMHLRVGATLHSESREQGMEALTLHLTSPETSTTAHYWYWSTRHFAISAEANAQIRKFIEFAFGEQDKPMLEAQQRAMRGHEFWSLKPLLLASDGGAVRVRRKLNLLMQSENPTDNPNLADQSNPAPMDLEQSRRRI